MLRYEWVDVGVLDYNPANKLYYVKRVYVPNHILQAKSAEFNSDKKEEKSKESGVKLEGEAGGASDGEKIAPQPKLSMQQVYTVMNHIGQPSFPFTVPVACGHLVRGYKPRFQCPCYCMHLSIVFLCIHVGC